MATRTAVLLEPGDVIDDFEVGAIIGKGTFSVVFEGSLLRRHRVALKLNRPGPRPDALKWESDVLSQCQQFPFFARHYGFVESSAHADGAVGAVGSVAPKEGVQVLAMQLLGPNVSVLRRQQVGEQFPLLAALYLAERMLYCLEALHAVGYLHRDVKPSNFATGVAPGGAGGGHLYVVDFGQTRQYTYPGGHKVRPPRPSADFRGTSLYSSLHAHEGADLGRVDDLLSWLYVLVDLARGGLPWRVCKDQRRRCAVLKGFYHAHPPQLFAGLPGATSAHAMYTHLSALGFSDKPDYSFLASQLRAMQDSAKAAGLETARLRPRYEDSEALRAALASLAGEEASGEGGEQRHPPGPTLPGTLKSAADISPPPIRQGEAASAGDMSTILLFAPTALRTSVDGVLHSRGGGWGEHTYDGVGADIAGVPLRDVLRVQANAEPTGEARAAYAGLLAAREVCERVVVEGYNASLPGGGGGGGGEGEEEGDGDGTPRRDGGVVLDPVTLEEWDDGGSAVERCTTALALHRWRAARVIPVLGGEPAPPWLLSMPRAAPPTPGGTPLAGLTEMYASRSVGWVVMDATRRAGRLGNDVLWATFSVIGRSKQFTPPAQGAEAAWGEGEGEGGAEAPGADGAPSAKRARTAQASALPHWRHAVALQAALASYVTAWTSVTRAVLGRVGKEKGGAHGLATRGLTHLLRTLVAAASAPPPLQLPHGGGEASDGIAVRVAQEALASIAASASAGGLGGLSLLAAGAQFGTLALSAQMALARVEALLKAEAAAAVGVASERTVSSSEPAVGVPASSFFDLTPLSAPVPLLGTGGGGGGKAQAGRTRGEEGDGDAEEEGALLAEARASLSVLTALITTIRKEREALRPPPAPEAARAGDSAAGRAAPSKSGAPPLPAPAQSSIAALPDFPGIPSRPVVVPRSEGMGVGGGGAAGVGGGGAVRRSRWEMAVVAPSAGAVGAGQGAGGLVGEDDMEI